MLKTPLLTLIAAMACAAPLGASASDLCATMQQLTDASVQDFQTIRDGENDDGDYAVNLAMPGAESCRIEVPSVASTFSPSMRTYVTRSA